MELLHWKYEKAKKIQRKSTDQLERIMLGFLQFHFANGLTDEGQIQIRRTLSLGASVQKEGSHLLEKIENIKTCQNYEHTNIKTPQQ